MIEGTPGVAGGAAGSGTSGAANLGDATHLFTRTTSAGVTIRAYDIQTAGTCTCGPIPVDPPTSPPSGVGSQTTPSVASVTSDISVELSDDTSVGQGFLTGPPVTGTTSPLGTGGTTEPLATTTGAFGVVEGAPVWWVAVSVGAEIANVEATFADGSTDQMSPVDGTAVLAQEIEPSAATSGTGPYDVRATLKLLDATGTVIASVTLPEPASNPTPPSNPTPLPAPAPSSPPAAVPGAQSSTPSASVPTIASPPPAGGVMFACPQVQTSTSTAK